MGCAMPRSRSGLRAPPSPASGSNQIPSQAMFLLSPPRRRMCRAVSRIEREETMTQRVGISGLFVLVAALAAHGQDDIVIEVRAGAHGFSGGLVRWEVPEGVKVPLPGHAASGRGVSPIGVEGGAT